MDGERTERKKNCRLATHPYNMICIISWLANEGTSSNVDYAFGSFTSNIK